MRRKQEKKRVKNALFKLLFTRHVATRSGHDEVFLKGITPYFFAQGALLGAPLKHSSHVICY